MDRAAYYTQLKSLLIKHEGLRLSAYRCPAGKLTIGVGHNLDDLGLTNSELAMIKRRNPAWQYGDEITEQEAMEILGNDIAIFETALSVNVPAFDGLSPRRQMALVDMAFNLGLPRFLKFKKMLAAIEAGGFARAAIEMLDSKWADQVGKKYGQRAYTLAEMMTEG